MFCEHCGNELSTGATFCGKCGKPVGGADAVSSPQPPNAGPAPNQGYSQPTYGGAQQPYNQPRYGGVQQPYNQPMYGGMQQPYNQSMGYNDMLSANYAFNEKMKTLKEIKTTNTIVGILYIFAGVFNILYIICQLASGELAGIEGGFAVFFVVTYLIVGIVAVANIALGYGIKKNSDDICLGSATVYGQAEQENLVLLLIIEIIFGSIFGMAATMTQMANRKKILNNKALFVQPKNN